MLMHLSLGHVTLLRAKFQPFYFSQIGLTARWALPQILGISSIGSTSMRVRLHRSKSTAKWPLQDDTKLTQVQGTGKLC